MQERAAGVALLGARPLDAALGLEALPRHAGVHWRERSEFLPEFLCGRPTPVGGAHALSQVGDDVDLLAGLSGRGHGGSGALDAALTVGDGAVGLGPTEGGREDHVGHLGGPGHEHVLDHHHVELPKQFTGMADVGLGIGRVLADDPQGLEFVPAHGLEHLGEVPSVLGGDRRAVDRLEPGPGFVVLDVLEAGQLVGQGTHVSASLHVVLAT